MAKAKNPKDTGVKDQVLNLRLTTEQRALIDQAVQTIFEATGLKVSAAAAALNLIELGAPELLRRYGQLKKIK